MRRLAKDFPEIYGAPSYSVTSGRAFEGVREQPMIRYRTNDQETWTPDITFNYETACDMIRLSLEEGTAFPEQAIATAKWVIEGVHSGRLKIARAPKLEFKDAA